MLPILSIAQSDSTETQKVIVTTTDGLERVGIILMDDGREILLLTESIGKVYIKKEHVISIERVPNAENDMIEEYMGDYRTSGPFTTRYYFTTNALPIKKGEDYAMLHLYGPEVHYALNNRLSVGIMTSWIASPFVLAVKYSIPTSNEKINFGLGSLVGSSGYLNNFRGFGGLHWGMVTFGNRMRNITLSAGYSYVQPGFRRDEYQIGEYDWTETPYSWDTTQTYWSPPTIPREELRSSMVKAPVISIAGITKVGKRASFFVDAMAFFYSNNGTQSRNREDIYNPILGDVTSTVITSADPAQTEGTVLIVMPGMRFQKKENRAFQIALAGYTRIREGNILSFPVPMCSWLLKF
jgi:hypothetical protein